MITADTISAALNLTGVTLTVEGARATITANEPVTDAMQAQVQAWWDAGEISNVVKLDSDTVLTRMTDTERAALFTARRTVWQVDYFLTRAASTGIVSTADPDLPAAQAMFAQLGIIAADRWPALLAP